MRGQLYKLLEMLYFAEDGARMALLKPMGWMQKRRQMQERRHKGTRAGQNRRQRKHRQTSNDAAKVQAD